VNQDNAMLKLTGVSELSVFKTWYSLCLWYKGQSKLSRIC
jgi:hypothetical protein